MRSPATSARTAPPTSSEIGEYYLVSPQLWEDKLHLKWDDNLCIGCLETRLGRKLRGRDLITWALQLIPGLQ